MPLNVKVQNADGYDRQLTEKLLDLTILNSVIPEDKNKINYTTHNKVLESIIMSIKRMGSMTVVSDNSKETIDLIISPYKRKGKNVSVDINGEFKDSEYGLCVIKVRPEHGEITLDKLPDDVVVCKRNHKYAILKFPSTQVYSGVRLDVMINIFYERSKVKEAIKEYTSVNHVPAA
jgi:hypothetical protein